MTRHVVFPFIGQEVGGSHVSAFTLAQSLQNDFGYRCTVIAREGSLIASEAASMGFGVVATAERAAGRHNPLYDSLRILPRWRTLQGLQATIVHTNDIGAHQSWLMPSFLCRLPIVYHHRSLNRRVLPNTMLIRAASHVIAISDETRRSVDFCPPGNVTTITDPFAIDRSTDRAAARQWLIRELALQDDASIIGYVGNFWLRKRPEFFIEVASHMARTMPHLAFVFFGRDGELTVADLRALADKYGVAPQIHFAGFRLPVERNVAALDLLLMPAVREPFGRTPIEAALLGTPYIATDDAGHSEIERRWGGGLLVDKNASAADFAARALALLAQPGSVLLSLESRARVAEDVSPNSHAKNVIAVYDRLLKH